MTRQIDHITVRVKDRDAAEVAFAALSREAVDRFHETALRAGGT